MVVFQKLCLFPLVLEVAMILSAMHAAATTPVGGDPTLRYLKVGIPSFWACVLPIFIICLALYFKGQSVTISPRAFIYRRGAYTAILSWSDALYTAPSLRKFDRQFLVATRDNAVVIRSLFFPRFDEMAETIARQTMQRDSEDYTV